MSDMMAIHPTRLETHVRIERLLRKVIFQNALGQTDAEMFKGFLDDLDEVELPVTIAEWMKIWGWQQPEKPPQDRIEILNRAAELTDGERNFQHGDPVAQHRACAHLWNAYLDLSRFRGMPPDEQRGIHLQAPDVAIMMALVKLSRMAHGDPLNMDNFVDAAGYIAIAGECVTSDQDSN